MAEVRPIGHLTITHPEQVIQTVATHICKENTFSSIGESYARAQFLATSGLGPDDVTRELASGTLPDGTPRVVTEHRWSASI